VSDQAARVAVAAAAMLALAAGGGWFYKALSEQPNHDGDAAGAATTAAALGESATPVAVVEPQPASALVQDATPPSGSQQHAIVYPGGVRMPALNGVQQDLQIKWGVMPFTPVTDIVRGDNGWDWYVHENGARSTVANSHVNGIPQVIGVVAEPGQPLPLLPANVPTGDQTPASGR
jgi:hypothetical protein